MEQSIIAKAISLRKKGLKYSEIQSYLGLLVPKSTMTYWFRNLELSLSAKIRLEKHRTNALSQSRLLAVEANKVKRAKYLSRLYSHNLYLSKLVGQKENAKIALTILYLCEGSKNSNGSVVFGNSNPKIIRLFMDLLSRVYDVDRSKFRLTVQCRSDQNITKLELFWRKLTGIPASQIYRAQIDPRTKNKPTLNRDYKGVCRVTYLSAEVLNDIMATSDVLLGL